MASYSYNTSGANTVSMATEDNMNNNNNNNYYNSVGADSVDYNNSYDMNNTNDVESANNSNVNKNNNKNNNNSVAASNNNGNNNDVDEAHNSQVNNVHNNNNNNNNNDANNNNNINNSGNFTNKEGRMINGVLYPKAERKIDVQGYETTKHALRFHGSDWDIPLTQKRDDLTKSLIQGAAEATGEPEENIQNVRFVVNTTYLYTKFTVRHKISVSITEVQKKLAEGKWTAIKELYEPRQKKSHTSSERTHQHSSVNSKAAVDKKHSTSAHSQHVHRQHDNSSNTYPAITATGVTMSAITVNTPALTHNISFFGRANVGPEGPVFVDDIDRDEEPPNFQDPEVIRMRSKSEHIVIPYSLPT